MNGQKTAIVLLSGGLDSATVLAIAAQDHNIIALSFHYGQRHAFELACARKLAHACSQVQRHVVIDVDLKTVGGSALTSDSISVPKHDSVGGIGTEIPVTYVPARNTIFLSYALAWAEAVSARDIFIGVNALDYSGYPDCRPQFIEAFESLANLATKAGVESNAGPVIRIHAPLIDMTKAEIIQTGLRLGVNYASTSSCYDPLEEGIACGKCDSCLLRLAGFAANQVADPIVYTR